MDDLLTVDVYNQKCAAPEGCPLQEACLRNLRPAGAGHAFGRFYDHATAECGGFDPVASWTPAVWR